MTDEWGTESLMRRLYPDLAAHGGLAAAMQEAARLRGWSIAPVVSAGPGARFDTGRGRISVELSKERRNFLVGIHTPGFTWAVGSTDDLGRLVEAVSAWSAGMPLDDFETRFDFMRLDEFARALEAGDVTPLQWSRLLASDLPAQQRTVLCRIHADDKLRGLFPTVTHGVVRLRVDPMDTAVQGHALIERLAGDAYRVKVVGEPDATHTTASLDELIERLRGRFREVL